MPSCDGRYASVGGLVLVLCATAHGGTLQMVHAQRYAMGTMFDVVVYHVDRARAERAADAALDEVVRLDGVLSHFDAKSDLAALVRDARRGVARAGPELYAVIAASLELSRLTAGAFDVTVAPLVRAESRVREEGRSLTETELRRARECVGYDKVQIDAPDRVQFASDCLDIDLGAIGKGYAVDRALALLRAAGIRDGVVNAGGSSIAATGTTPGRDGWPVSLGLDESSNDRLVSLRDGSVSTSRRSAGTGFAGDIVDPRAPPRPAHDLTVGVFAPTATASDALSTALVMMTVSEGTRLIEALDDVAAVWIAPSGAIASAAGSPRAGIPRQTAVRP